MPDTYDAILSDWSVIGCRLYGTIVWDHKGRFKPGDAVRTSTLRTIERDTQGVLLAATLNSTYMLV